MSLNPLRILVTAVGGDLGQAILKALRLSQKPIQLHGCDANPSGVGAAFVDSYHVLPPAHNEGLFLDALDMLCCSSGIQVVVPGSEAEMAVLSRLGTALKLPCGATVVCHQASWINTYGDKLNCMRALEGKSRLAPFADGSDLDAVQDLVAQVGFPLVVKSRQSSGSKSLCLAHTQLELQAQLKQVPLPVVQQYLDNIGGEFSAGVFVCDHFRTIIAFKRELGPAGCSWYAETSDDQLVLEYVQSIAYATGLRGSANVQVRKTTSGVRLLEINTRFSSLVAARAICGFTDVEWWIEMALGLSLTPPPASYRRIRFRRFFHEVIDFGDGFHAVADWCPRQCSSR